jgi:hypothetical protein
MKTVSGSFSVRGFVALANQSSCFRVPCPNRFSFESHPGDGHNRPRGRALGRAAIDPNPTAARLIVLLETPSNFVIWRKSMSFQFCEATLIFLGQRGEVSLTPLPSGNIEVILKYKCHP